MTIFVSRSNAVVLALAGLLSAAAAIASADLGQADSGELETLEFQVFLDDSKIGFHRYKFSDSESGREVHSKARFDVKFLFFSAFKYRHELEARWVDDCLVKLDARTNSNGDKTVVAGERVDGAFVIDATGERRELPNCVMTFAYWNPDFLEQSRLLNPQTGKYLDVDVEELGVSPVQTGRGEQDAYGYTVRAKDYEVTVWYSADGNEWLALESPAKGGRTIRYELT